MATFDCNIVKLVLNIFEDIKWSKRNWVIFGGCGGRGMLSSKRYNLNPPIFFFVNTTNKSLGLLFPLPFRAESLYARGAVHNKINTQIDRYTRYSFQRIYI